MFYRKWTWYGKKIPGEWACMDDNHLIVRKTQRYCYKEKSYFFCCRKSFIPLKQHFKEVVIAVDAFSGDSINKADALIGLRQRGKPELVYFKNEYTFRKYYGLNK